MFQQFLDAIDYRIASGGAFGGDRVVRFITTDLTSNNVSATMLFDKIDKRPLFITLIDFKQQRAYSYIDALYEGRPIVEADHIDAIDIEFDDIIEKIRGAVVDGYYDPRIKITIELPEDQITKMAIEAHQRDITLNQLMNEVMVAALQQEGKQDPPGSEYLFEVEAI